MGTKDGGNPTESAGMGTIVAGIPRGWNLLLQEIRGVFGKRATIRFLVLNS